MQSDLQRGVDWRALFAHKGFPWLFAAMFISLFGSGMNFHGVTWYVQTLTGSSVQVAMLVVLVTLPGLVVPPFGGVLIDRVDRRYLTMTLDVVRGVIVLSVAALAYQGHAKLIHIYVMVLLLGVGFSIYWSTLNALVQEVAPEGLHLGANAATLISVQTGMMAAGALVGFVYQRAGIAGILGIDGLTYFGSALCLWRLRQGYQRPRKHLHLPSQNPAAGEDEAETVLPPIVEPGVVLGFVRDLQEGLRYLRTQPRVMAAGTTYAFMMAGVLSANVLLVVLALRVIHTGPVGYGYLELGWGVGAATGGAITGWVTRRYKIATVLITAMVVLSVGHAVLPLVHWLALGVLMQALFGASRALGGVLTQSSLMTTVPHALMGRVQSAFSVISTLLQVVMSLILGLLAEHSSLPLAFGALALLYGGAVFAAVRAGRQANT
ncbi:MAG: MFS transporter [Acidobacteria bacterium]|nr:MFS transporter [Acidobacteriota bacterium]